MFIYVNPETGKSARVDALDKSYQEINKDFVVRWAGGGAWDATKEQLRGKILREADLTPISDERFESALEYVLGGTAEAMAATQTVTEPVEEED